MQGCVGSPTVLYVAALADALAKARASIGHGGGV